MLNAPWRLGIAALAFAVGFAGMWLYISRDSDEPAGGQPTPAPTVTTAQLGPSPVFVPGLACDGCEVSE